MLASIDWTAVAGIGSGVGGIGAAVGAVAAWRAASASQSTSRDALEALAVGIRPTLRVQFANVTRGDGQGLPRTSQHVAWIINESEWAAADVTFEMQFRDGRVARSDNERLAPSKDVEPMKGGEHLEIVLAEAPEGGVSFQGQAESAMLRYSDQRRIARYEVAYGFSFTEDREGPITGRGWATTVGERRRI
jgi:hypothetical protein